MRNKNAVLGGNDLGFYLRAAGVSVLIGCGISVSWAQNSVSQDPSPLRFIKTLEFNNCIEDIPAPQLQSEPRYTKGSSNIVYFTLPSLESIPFSPDTVKNPFVITRVQQEGGLSGLNFPRPVVLGDESVQAENISALKNGVKYEYSTALFLPVCKINCEAVVDSTDLEVHCSVHQNTVWSVQDSDAPMLQNVRSPQLDSSPVPGWWNRPTLDIEAVLSDPAGVWQGFLYRRECLENGWGIATADTTFPGDSTNVGFVFSESARATFEQTLSDGCYEFRIGGKDATHTPESSFPIFELAGNSNEPESTDLAHISIKIDTQPPASNTLRCEQNLDDIDLSWTSSQDAGTGIGLAGYRVLRNDQLLATVSAADLTYIDAIAAGTEDTRFEYKVQPFDSLGNIQTAGGTAICRYQSVSQITMLPEPDFSPGSSNRVSWAGSSQIDSYSLFTAEECNFDAAIETTVTDTFFTFAGLKDATNYCYWVTAVDRQNRQVVSDTVRSIQDATKPAISSLDVRNVQDVDGLNWINSREIEIHLNASDSAPGLIRNIQVFENGSLAFEQPADAFEIDRTFSRTVSSAECSAIELSVKVIDAAGNESDLQLIELYLDESPPTQVVSLSCAQIDSMNGVLLNWTPANESGNCSGLAGYKIFRDNEQIANLSAEATSYEDLFSGNRLGGPIDYQVQPFDLVGNIQISGGLATCDYVGASRIITRNLPEFSPGLSNEVCWTIAGPLVSTTLFMDENCDLRPEDAVFVASPGEFEMCHTFENLSDGQKYCYWVSGVDEQQRIVNSDTIFSTQDNTSPVVAGFTFPQGENLNGRIWAYSRDIQLNLIARDASPGVILKYEVFENNQAAQIVELLTPTSELSLNVPYTLSNTSSSQSGQFDLSIRVFDAAGNSSNLGLLSLNLQENQPDLFAFPNPCNPMRGPVTIRLRDVNEIEVKIYDFFGNLVRRLDRKVNNHDFTWDGKNGYGEMVANGGYFCVGSKTGDRFKIAILKERNE